MGKNKKRPSQTRRRRESAAARRKARAFYRQRHGYGGDALPKDEAEGLAPWRGAEVVLVVVVATAVVGWIATRLFS